MEAKIFKAFGKQFWRTTREIMNATAVKLIVAALAAIGVTLGVDVKF